MTSRERLLAVLHGVVPDCVPVCPDISNMVPCRLTGKPFWDIYAYQDPPLWKAHIDALKKYDLDGGFELYDFGPEDPVTGYRSPWQEWVVKRFEDGGFATQRLNAATGDWAPEAKLYSAANPPATGVAPEKLGLPPIPRHPEPLEKRRTWPAGLELWNLIRGELGDQGVLGMPSGMATSLMQSVGDVYAYHDDPRPFHERAERVKAEVRRRMELIAKMTPRPDFLFCGASGSLVFQTPRIFRELVLPVLRLTTELAAEIGIPTHVHSCGRQRELVKMAAEETRLTIIDPLEIAPMGDCDLADLKERYGTSIVLKGNLHTTQVMLHGAVDDVVRASRQAMDDAAQGGGFVLSTGDQCGRDTPDENIAAMVDTARTYGRYREAGDVRRLAAV